MGMRTLFELRGRKAAERRLTESHPQGEAFASVNPLRDAILLNGFGSNTEVFLCTNPSDKWG